MAWTVETLNEVVDAELEELPADMLARFRYISQLIEEFGLERAREPHVARAGASLGNAPEGPGWDFAGLYVTFLASV